LGLDVEAPTLRWVFQLLYGVNYLNVSLGDQHHQGIEGITCPKTKNSTGFLGNLWLRYIEFLMLEIRSHVPIKNWTHSKQRHNNFSENLCRSFFWRSQM